MKVVGSLLACRGALFSWAINGHSLSFVTCYENIVYDAMLGESRKIFVVVGSLGFIGTMLV